MAGSPAAATSSGHTLFVKDNIVTYNAFDENYYRINEDPDASDWPQCNWSEATVEPFHGGNRGSNLRIPLGTPRYRRCTRSGST